MASTVNVPTPQYIQMWDRWRLLLCLLEGTAGMRSAGSNGPFTGDGQIYLPKMQRETTRAFEGRRDQTVLFNAFRRTLRVLTGLPFRKPVIVKDGSDPLVFRMKDNVDRTGRSLNSFARLLLWDLLCFGKCHFFVDAPQVDTSAAPGGKPTLADERRLNLFPYFVHISPLDIIGWQTAWTSQGEQLTQVRQRTSVAVPDATDPFRSSEQRAVRVWTPEFVQQYIESADTSEVGGKTTDYMAGPVSALALGHIPLVTVYASEELKTGALACTPPLEDLAWMNAIHWQSGSDQRNILHFARIYFLLFAGFTPEEVENLEIGPGFGVSNSKVDARVDVIEHSGAAIGAGERDLQAIEERMQAMGADWVSKRPVNTATERIINNAESMSDLQSVVRNLETGLEQGFRLAGEWRGTAELEVGIDIYQDFDSYGSDAGHGQRLARAQAGYITQRTLLREDKANGLFSDSLDVEEELIETQFETGDDREMIDEMDPAAAEQVQKEEADAKLQAQEEEATRAAEAEAAAAA